SFWSGIKHARVLCHTRFVQIRIEPVEYLRQHFIARCFGDRAVDILRAQRRVVEIFANDGLFAGKLLPHQGKAPRLHGVLGGVKLKGDAILFTGTLKTISTSSTLVEPMFTWFRRV